MNLKGTGVSSGIGIGTIVLVKEDEIVVVQRAISDIDGEKQRYHNAVRRFIEEIEHAYKAVSKNVGKAEADILTAQIAIIQDPELTSEVTRAIEGKRSNAEYAFAAICDGYIQLFSSLEDELIRARAADFYDIKQRMLRILLGIDKVDFGQVEVDSILVAKDISPSQAAMIDPTRIRGIVTQAGTRFSHISIIARAMQLPAVVAVDNLLQTCSDGDRIVVDGASGKVLVDPDPGTLARYRKWQQIDSAERRELEEYRDRETRTADGVRVNLEANLTIVQELDLINEYRADGIGLFRTEFLFMEKHTLPTEQEQFEVYSQVARSMQGKPALIRTLDVGGDKEVFSLHLSREENPFLGHRGVRYSLSRTDVFKTQLSALLRAARYGDVRIMIPMISTITELRQVRSQLEHVQQELRAQEIPAVDRPVLGVMIETPAAVMCAGDLARECDFFSVGTNDLTQYTLAVDRGNEQVAYLYNHMHPSVLRMIAMTVKAAHEAGITVGVCGEGASDPAMIPFLIGVGIDSLSVSSSQLLAVRRQIHSLSQQYWKEKVPEILRQLTVSEVTRCIRDAENDAITQ